MEMGKRMADSTAWYVIYFFAFSRRFCKLMKFFQSPPKKNLPQFFPHRMKLIKNLWLQTEEAHRIIPGRINLIADADYNWYNGYTTPQEDEIILNAEITKLLFKNKCTLALKAYDILGQSKNLSVSDSANYHIETRNNTLGRYIILSLTTVLVTSVVQVADADREAQCVALWRPTVLEIDT